MEQAQVLDAIRTMRETYTVETNIAKLSERYIQYCREHYAASTMPSKVSRLRGFVRFCELAEARMVADIDVVIVEVYLIEYARKSKASSVNAARKDVLAFLEWLGQQEIPLSFNPAVIKRREEPNKLPRALDYTMVQSVIQRIDNPQDRIMIGLTVEAGLRLNELFKLRVADLSGRSIHVRGKGDCDRTVRVTAEFAAELYEFLEEFNRTDIIFKDQHWRRDKPMSKGTMRTRMQKYFLELAGIAMTPHQLRHTFAINLLTAGCDIVTIQKLLGHRYIETTMQYLRVADKFIHRQYDKHMTSVLA